MCAAGPAAARTKVLVALTALSGILAGAPTEGAVCIGSSGAETVALVESGLVSEVKAGENAGKRLVHDHVVRVLSEPIPLNARGDATAELALPCLSMRGSP